jgi:hypothetical protein
MAVYRASVGFLRGGKAIINHVNASDWEKAMTDYDNSSRSPKIGK